MSQYLTLTTYQDLTLAPASYVEFVETEEPGWIGRQLTHLSALIDAKLAKRYETPFASDSPPTVVCDWLRRLMDPRLYYKRGIDPTDKQIVDLKDDAKAAWA